MFIYLEKAYDRVDSEVLRIYCVGGQLLKEIQAFRREKNACVRVGGSSVSFAVEAGVRQGCLTPPWLFNH